MLQTEQKVETFKGIARYTKVSPVESKYGRFIQFTGVKNGQEPARSSILVKYDDFSGLEHPFKDIEQPESLRFGEYTPTCELELSLTQTSEKREWGDPSVVSLSRLIIDKELRGYYAGFKNCVNFPGLYINRTDFGISLIQDEYDRLVELDKKSHDLYFSVKVNESSRGSPIKTGELIKNDKNSI